MPHDTHLSNRELPHVPARPSILDKLDKPTVAVPMILFSALIGLALAVAVVRVLDGRSATSDISAPVAARTAQARHPGNAASLKNGALGTLPPTSSIATAAPPVPQASEAHTQPDGPAETTTPVFPALGPQRPAPKIAALSPAPSMSTASPTPSRSSQMAQSVAEPPARSAFPAVSSEAQRNVADVLAAAAQAERASQTPAVLDAAENVRRAQARRDRASSIDPARARRLNEEANRAYWVRQDLAEALDLERRAFEANPDDVEIAGNLAFYYLKQARPQADLARAAALHALTTPSGRYRTGRVEDWTSFGVANALLGRSAEARNAFLATAALSNDADRLCRAALSAVASYGDAVRGPATALLYRIYAQGRSRESPYCAWPPNWGAGRR